MSIYNKRFPLAGLFILFLILTGCGGGGGQSGEPGGTNVAIYGSISSVGTIVVNGSTLKTKNALLQLPDDNIFRTMENDNVIRDEGLLKPGMVVSIKGVKHADGTVTAQEIQYMDNLEGMIESKTASSMVVMGQTIIPESSAMTVFNTLVSGDIVEVSGFFDPSANVRATYLEKKPGRTGDYEIKGFIYSVTGPSSFTLRTVNLPGSHVFYTVNVESTGGLNSGDQIAVITDSVPVAGVIAAKQVNFTTDISIDFNYKLELEGFVYNPRLQFDSFNFIYGYDAPLMIMTPNTVIVGGIKTDLTEGRKVELEAEFIDVATTPYAILHYKCNQSDLQ